MRTLKIDTVITEPKLARYCGVSISGITVKPHQSGWGSIKSN
jgi:hypothetical protein